MPALAPTEGGLHPRERLGRKVQLVEVPQRRVHALGLPQIAVQALVDQDVSDVSGEAHAGEGVERSARHVLDGRANDDDRVDGRIFERVLDRRIVHGAAVDASSDVWTEVERGEGSGEGRGRRRSPKDLVEALLRFEVALRESNNFLVRGRIAPSELPRPTPEGRADDPEVDLFARGARLDVRRQELEQALLMG